VVKLPDLTDEAAMLLRGRRSAIRSMREECMIALRDAYTHLQTMDYEELSAGADAVVAAAERLKTVAALWEEFGS
jgi:hypothetical protein